MDNSRAYLESSIEGENYNLLDLTDGTLLTEDGHSFPIHKFLLARCNSKFSDILWGMQKDERDVLIPGIRGELLSNILTYIYHGRIHITEENICDVFEASHYLSLKNLLSQTKTFLDEYLSVGNCVAVYLSALKMNCMDFLKESYRFIQTHFEELVYSTDINFCELPVDNLIEFFKDGNLRVQNEKVVWHAIVKWVEADPTDRLPQVLKLLMYLRLCDVDRNLALEIFEHDIIANNPITNDCITSQGCKHPEYGPDPTALKPRKPPSLNFISEYFRTFEEPAGVEIYVTYDENIDLWRKIMALEFFPTFVACVDNFVYVFDKGYNKMRYSIIEDELEEISDFRIPRSHYTAVQLNGFLYILGGYSDSDDLSPDMDHRLSRIYDVEVYSPEEEEWHEIMPMLPVVFPFHAVTLNGSIYVVGVNDTEKGLCAQMYNPSTKIWQLLPKPPLFSRRKRFALAAYKDRLYVIGAVNTYDNKDNVQVFCPLKNAWNFKWNLPYRYEYPRALILNDRLIVSEDPLELDCPPVYPPVMWKNDEDCWEPIEESSPLFNIHYHIFAAQEIDYLNDILRKNKMPTTVFEKSPFA